MNQAKRSNGDVPEGLPLPTEEPHCWFYDKSEIRDSPSLNDGISTELEIRYRREGARFIINLGNKMGMQHITVATSVVFFHRFYMSHSFKEFPRYVTACCCFFLAGKVEETPKKCKDVINAARTLLTDAQFAQFGDDPKDEVMTLERILLKTIRFDFNVEHPYTSLLKYAKCLKGDKSKVQKMVQMAWTFINDSFCTTLCLEWEPEVIAVAVIYLAGKLCKFKVKDWTGRSSEHNHWWDMYVSGLTIEFLEDICHQILDLYSTPVSENPQDSPPPTKSTRQPDQVPSSPKTSPSVEVPVGEQVPRPEPEDLKLKTPKSASRNDSDESLEVTTVLPSQRNSSNVAVMYVKPSLSGMPTSCGVEKYSDSNRNSSEPLVFSPATGSAPCGSVKLSGSKRCTPVPTVRNQSTICSIQEPGHDNVSSDSGKNYCKSADALNSGDPGKVSGAPGSLATENNASREKIEMCSFIETVAPMPRSDSSSSTYVSENVLNAFEAVSLNPVNTTAVTPLDVNVNYPYFSAMAQPPQPPAKFLPPPLRMGLTAPPPPPNILIPPPQFTVPLPMQFPDVLPAPPQFQPSSLPPPQSVPTASKPQFPPPPPLHVRGLGPVPNPVSQSSSNITRMPPPLLRAPVPTNISSPGTAQVSTPAPPSLPSNPQNAPRPSLSQSAPRPSFQSGFHSSPQAAHYLVRRQNTPQPKSQNTPHDGTQNISHSHSQQGFLWQNLPPPPVSMADMSGSRGDSNPVPRFPEARNISSENAPSLQEPHSARHSTAGDSKYPPMHLEERENPHELGWVGARNPYDSNVYPHFHQETDSPAAYAGISHERKYSRNGQNHRQRRRGHNQYAGHSYKSNIPAHLRLTPYPSLPGHHRIESQSGSHQPPSSTKPIFPNEMLRGPPRGRSPSRRNITEPSDYDENSET